MKYPNSVNASSLYGILNDMHFSKMTYFFLSLILTGCFYAKVQLTPSDKQLIPYKKDFKQLFQNTANVTDTLLFSKNLIRPSNFDFFIDKRLERNQDSKRPYIESYSTDINLEKTILKSKTKEPYIKYAPIIFSFCKYQNDPQLTLYYNIDGRWNGTVSFDTVKTGPLTVGKATLNDVFVIENTTRDLFSISKLYWSIKYGLVRIDEKSGDSWTVLADLE